jgi:hypothetical protein
VATSRAFPGEPFHGKLAFVYPHVDEATRTVTIRCEAPNPGHKLRPGTTATVTLEVPPEHLSMLSQSAADDPERQAKLDEGLVLAVPESSVIDTGNQRIVYRESLPNVFEGVQVELGPRMTGPEGAMFYPVLAGLESGDLVVAAGSFLVDAETRLNPAAGSIYFGGSGGSKSGASVTTARPSTPADPDAKIEAALAALSSEDRTLAETQKYCPILKSNLLGSMGVPVKLAVAGRTVFVCCEGCREKAVEDADATLAQVAKLRGGKNAAPASGRLPAAASQITPPQGKSKDPEARIKAALATLSPADRKNAEVQRFCAVLEDSRLGSMGVPVKLTIDGQTVFVCCAACTDDAQTNVKETLDKVKELKRKHTRP